MVVWYKYLVAEISGNFICKEQEIQGICAAENLEEILRLRRIGLE